MSSVLHTLLVRVTAAALVLIGVSILIFTIARVIPGVNVLGRSIMAGLAIPPTAPPVSPAEPIEGRENI